jgi:threonine synthase
MNHIKHFRCLICGRTYTPDEVDYVCPLHGDEGILDVEYDYDAIRARISPESLAAERDSTIWRYKALLPVRADSPVPPLAVGGTPLYRADRLAASLGLRHLWVKDDGRQPTASFKDRASAVAVVKAQERGFGVVTTASTGNAAAALAGLCASVGMRNVIFVPESAPPAKVAQLLVFGSTVLLVRGTYDDAFELCLQAAKAFGWYNRNTGYNPLCRGQEDRCIRNMRTTDPFSLRPLPPWARRWRRGGLGCTRCHIRLRRRRVHHRRSA